MTGARATVGGAAAEQLSATTTPLAKALRDHWLNDKRVWEEAGNEDPTDEALALLREAKERLWKFPVTTAEELALRVIIETNNGDFSPDTDSFWADVHRIARLDDAPTPAGRPVGSEADAEITRAIDRYKAARTAYAETCERHEFQGDGIRGDFDLLASHAGAVRDALLSLCAQPATTISGAKAKAEVLREIFGAAEEVDGRFFAGLLNSIAEGRYPAEPSGACAGQIDETSESEVMKAFRDWRAYLDWSNAQDEAGDEETDRQVQVRFEMEDRLLATPSRDARDVLAKFLVITLFGDVSPGRRTDDDAFASIFDEAERFVAGARCAHAASEISQLFREWHAADATWKTFDMDEQQDQHNAWFDVQSGLIDRIVATPATSLTDLAAKLVAVCDWDDEACFCYERSKAILKEVSRIASAATGLTPTSRGGQGDVVA